MDNPGVLALVMIFAGLGALGLVVWQRNRDADRRHDLASEKIQAGAQVDIATAAAVNRSPLPLAQTFSPQYHIQYQLTGGAGPERVALADPVVAESAAPALPGVTTLGQVLDTGWRPSLQSILLAQGPGGVPLTVPVGDDLCHIILAGRTGAGKTNIMRLLLVQLLAAGCAVYLLNPKYTVRHYRTGERWDRIAAATAPGRAVTDLGQICAVIRQVATTEFATRKARFEAGHAPGQPLFLVLDELPAIIGHDPDLMDPKTGALSLLLRQGREYLIEILICSQDVLVETLGGNSGLRGQFQTRYYGGGDETSKRVLLQPRAKEILPEPPGRGLLYLWAVPTGRQAQMVRVPLVTNEDIDRVLATNEAAVSPVSPPFPPVSGPVSGEVVQKRSGPPLEMDAQRVRAVREAVRTGHAQGEILEQIWAVKAGGGASYKAATEEFRTILAWLVSNPSID